MSMETLEATVKLPSSFLTATKLKEDELEEFIRRSLAAELYREGKLSLGKAAEVAGARNKWEMLMILNEKRYSNRLYCKGCRKRP